MPKKIKRKKVYKAVSLKLDLSREHGFQYYFELDRILYSMKSSLSSWEVQGSMKLKLFYSSDIIRLKFLNFDSFAIFSIFLEDDHFYSISLELLLNSWFVLEKAFWKVWILKGEVLNSSHGLKMKVYSCEVVVCFNWGAIYLMMNDLLSRG